MLDLYRCGDYSGIEKAQKINEYEISKNLTIAEIAEKVKINLGLYDALLPR